MYSFVVILSPLLLFSCGSYQNLSSPSQAYDEMPNEPGKCYAKCLPPNNIIVETFTFPIYYGDDIDIIESHTKTEIIEITPSTSKWVKKKADRNCKSSDPNDCLVWCLEEVPGQKLEIEYCLMDTTVTNEFQIESYDVNYKNTDKKTVWMSVLCDPIDTKLVEIQQMLIAEGYDVSVEMRQGIFSKASKNALSTFQEENGLHIGQLTEETMDVLGISY